MKPTMDDYWNQRAHPYKKKNADIIKPKRSQLQGVMENIPIIQTTV